MPQTAGAKLALYLFGSLLIIVTIVGLAWSRGYWKERTERWEDEAGVVTAAAATLTENPKLQWKDVAQQLGLFGTAHNQLLKATREVTVAINQQGAETKRLKKLNAELRVKADKLIAERSKLLGRLAQRSLDPGDRENCQEQLGAIVRALNEIYEEGY